MRGSFFNWIVQVSVVSKVKSLTGIEFTTSNSASSSYRKTNSLDER